MENPAIKFEVTAFGTQVFVGGSEAAVIGKATSDEYHVTYRFGNHPSESFKTEEDARGHIEAKIYNFQGEWPVK